MDVLSDTLRVVRLSKAVFFTTRFSSPWALWSPPPDQLARLLNAQTDCITIFHIMVQGQCWITVNGQPLIRMETGDVIILPHGEAHTLGSQLDVTPQPITSIPPSRPPSRDEPLHIEYGGGGEVTRFICGYLQCHQQFNPFMESLPTLLWLRVGQRDELTGMDATALPLWCVLPIVPGAWLDTTLRHTVEEATGERPGRAVMLARLAELLFVEVLRRYMQQLPAEHAGWLAAVRDPEVGHALQLIHAHPERSWTVEDLAQEAALSRSALAQRFTTLLGEPPMHYLFGWRMQLAQYLLSQTKLSITEITDRVGYTSEAAFNRAFKRAVGQPPIGWRGRAASTRAGDG